MTHEQELENQVQRLQNQVAAQLEALHEWRKKADRDYVTLQRMYYALDEAYDFIGDHVDESVEGRNEVMDEIDEACVAVEFVPPKVFK